MTDNHAVGELNPTYVLYGVQRGLNGGRKEATEMMTPAFPTHRAGQGGFQEGGGQEEEKEETTGCETAS